MKRTIYIFEILWKPKFSIFSLISINILCIFLIFLIFKFNLVKSFDSENFTTESKIAIIAKESIIFDAVYDRPGASAERLTEEITKPVIAYLKSLQSQGFIVINTTLDSNGNMGIDALPKNVVDLSQELRDLLRVKH
jgi:hypothetical protein